MKILDLTLKTPHENIAVDEALLDAAEQNENAIELLRIWEPQAPIVVLGRSSPFSTEVNHEFCQQHSIPIIRRSSGGQTVVTDRGCLMYCVLLDYRIRPQLRMLEQAHAFVIKRVQAALGSIGIHAKMNGTSDLTLGEQQKKFSGNAMRAKRNWMIYHGTLLCDMNLDMIFDCSGKPLREPEYRRERSHREFLTTLETTTDSVKQALIETWMRDINDVDGGVSGPDWTKYQCTDWPQQMTEELVEEKYQTREWTEKVP